MTVLEGRGALSSAFSTAWCKHRESIHTRGANEEETGPPASTKKERLPLSTTTTCVPSI